MHRLYQACVPFSCGKNGIIWTLFPVRKSPVFFSVDEPSFLSVSSRSSRSSHQVNPVPDDTSVFDAPETTFSKLHAKGFFATPLIIVLLVTIPVPGRGYFWFLHGRPQL